MDALWRMIESIADVLYLALLQLREIAGSFGLAIILLTLLVKLALFPFVRRHLESVERVRRLSPQILALRERLKDDPRQLSTELANLYREHGIRPMANFLQVLLQLPILAGLWALFRRRNVFVPASQDVADRVLGIPLDATPNIPSILLHPGWLLVPLFVALGTLWQQSAGGPDPHQTWFLIAVALAIGYFAMQFPVGMSIYWITSSLVSVAEHYLVLGRRPPVTLRPQTFAQRPKRPKKK